MAPACPCGSGQLLADCCQPLLDERRAASTAEQLMRSRYSAYACGHIDYLLCTQSAHLCHPGAGEALRQSCRDCQWLQLHIVKTEQGGERDQRGIVEFIASYRQHNALHYLYERSSFVRVQGQWRYDRGEHPDTALPLGRNDPCWCASQRKYKHCHGR